MLVVGGQKQRRSAEQRDRIRRMNAAETIEVPPFTPTSMTIIAGFFCIPSMLTGLMVP
jgi:hypothetical protein